MKTSILSKSLIMGLACIFILSCKRDYTCKCTTSTESSLIPFPISVDSSFVITAKKNDADAQCKANDASASVMGVTVTTKCSIQ
ncbi:MAG: hypothetical protein ACO259_03615 [Bacteroidia bacterium]|jgi:hypothetical protein